MYKVGFTTLAVVALLCMAAAMSAWGNRLTSSIHGYATPLKGMPPLTEDKSQPLTSQVVMVVVDGLRFDESLAMPYLNALRKQGAHARLILRPPSSTLTSWTALLTGARPEINGAPLLDPPNDGIRLMAVDSLFNAIARAGLTSGVAGSARLQRLIPADLLYTTYYASAEGEEVDAAVIDRSVMFLNEFRPNFLLVQLGQVDAAGKRYGAASAEYRDAAQRCDQHLGRLISHLDLGRSIVIVTSGHGQLNSGGHGGAEDVLLSTPFVMMGAGIVASDYRSMDQVDVAPTVAALLGTPTPSAAQGGARLDMLRMSKVQSAERQVALAAQRVRIANVYLYSIGRGSVSETAEGDVQVARSSLLVKNYESAAELASLAVRQIGQEMAQRRSARIWQERRERGIPLGIAALLALWLLWRRRGTRVLWSLLASVLSVAIYHLLYLYQGNSYSFSRFPSGDVAATLVPALQRAVVALAAGAALTAWQNWRERERSSFAVLRSACAFAGLQLGMIGLGVGVCTFWNGPRFSWYVPNLNVAIWQITLLLQLMLVAAVSAPLLAVLPIVQRLALAVSDRLTRTDRH